MLCNLCRVVPGGVVCFFGSYAYAQHVTEYFEETGVTARLAERKLVLHEPRASTDLDALWKSYAEAIASVGAADPWRCLRWAPADMALCGCWCHIQGRGALLLCVVGGKMSEGINFSDDLARCVMVVGLPYPNSKDPELAERMKFLNQREAQHANATRTKHTSDQGGAGCAAATSAARKPARTPGEEYYENLCMNAVNQSIGTFAGLVLALPARDVWLCTFRKVHQTPRRPRGDRAGGFALSGCQDHRQAAQLDRGAASNAAEVLGCIQCRGGVLPTPSKGVRGARVGRHCCRNSAPEQRNKMCRRATFCEKVPHTPRRRCVVEFCAVTHRNLSHNPTHTNHYSSFPHFFCSFRTMADESKTQTSGVPAIKLNSGFDMPVVGLGTWKSKPVRVLVPPHSHFHTMLSRACLTRRCCCREMSLLL